MFSLSDSYNEVPSGMGATKQNGEAAKSACGLTGGRVFAAFALVALALIVACCVAYPVKAHADSAQDQTVRVGWYQSDLFQEGTSDGQVKSGYCYDYLQKVSDYTSWNYEYVYGEWPELMAKLQSGEIDFLAGVSPTDERRKTMFFPDSAMGMDQYYIYKHADDASISVTDLTTLNGKKAGGIKDNRAALFTEEWIKSNDLKVEMVYFDSFADQEAAFKRGDIDLMTQTINNVLSLSDITIVSKVGEEPFYLAVTKGRSDLLSQLNAALTTMLSVDPFLLENLQYANCGATLTSRTLSTGEAEWVKAHPAVTVGYLENYLPYSGTDSQGKATGLMTDVMGAIIESLGLNDSLVANYRGYANYTALASALKNGEVDAIFPVSGDLWSNEQEGIDVTASVVSCNEVFVFKGSYDPGKVSKIAVNGSNSLQSAYCKKAFPAAEQVVFSSIDECLKAVLDGKVDGTVINSLRTEMVTGTIKYRSLSSVMLDEEDGRCFGVQGGQTELLLLLNRGLKIIGTSYGLDHSYQYMDSLYSYGASDFLADNLWWMLLVGVLVVAVIVGLLLRNYGNKRRAAEESAAYANEVMVLNSELEERQAQLEEAASEQEAQIAEISVLNSELEERQAQLEEAAAEQEAQLEETAALNKELEESHANLSMNLSVIESSTERFFCMYWMDIAQDTFREIKALPHMGDVVGKTGRAQESIHRMYGKLVVPEDRQAMLDFSDMSTWVDRLSAANMASCEYRGVTSGWSRAWIFCAQRDDAGRCTHVVFANETIHEEVATREFLLEQQTHLDEARKQAEAANQAKTSFLFNMSHDIRTPMNAVMGFTKLLRKHQDDPERRADYLNKIEDSSAVLLSIINNVLDMARIESGAVTLNEESVKILEVKDNIVSAFADMMREKGIAFQVEADILHEDVYMDVTKAAQIMNNIISNAYKYTNPGGTVSVMVQELPSDREGYLVLRTTVSDTGIGMDADYLPIIFEEFSREHTSTEAKVEGTGLGMPIVKKLVDYVGGTIDVASEKGVGTTFTLEFPCRIAGGPEVPGDVFAPVDEPASLEGRRILLAEDNDLNAEIALEILGEIGFEVDRAEDGAVAVRRLIDAPADFYDVVLMDIQMPRMNGYEATRAIRGLNDPAKANIPILAMTANAFEEDKQESLRAGMDGHLAKPIDVPALTQALLSVLG